MTNASPSAQEQAARQKTVVINVINTIEQLLGRLTSKSHQPSVDQLLAHIDHQIGQIGPGFTGYSTNSPELTLGFAICAAARLHEGASAEAVKHCLARLRAQVAQLRSVNNVPTPDRLKELNVRLHTILAEAIRYSEQA